MNLIFNDELHLYLIDGEVVPGLTEIFTDLGIINNRFYTEEARERGRLIHLITELYDRGSLDIDTVDPRLLGYFEAYRNFLDKHNPEIIEIEKPIGNKVLKYASKLDRVFKMKIAPGYIGKIITDLKTGAKERWHQLQLTAHLMAYSKSHLPLYDLYLKPNGDFIFEEQEYIPNIIISIMNVYNWKH